MNKDEYLKYQNRANIVKSFIDKIDKFEIKDVDVIASLNRYVETGEESYFKEFCDFHFSKTTEERQKIINESVEKKKEIDNAISMMEQHRKDYYKYIEEYKKWYIKVFDSLHDDFPETGYLKLFELGKFIEQFKKRNGHERRLYCFVDGKLKPVKNIVYSANYNSVVMEIIDEGKITPEKPEYPKYVQIGKQIGKEDMSIICFDM